MSFQHNQVTWGLLNMQNCRDEIKLDKLKHISLDNLSEASDVSSDYNKAVNAINAKYAQDDPQRQIELDNAKGMFDFLNTQIEYAEAENKVEIEELSNTIKDRKTWMDSLKTKIKDEVKEDFKYGY